MKTLLLVSTFYFLSVSGYPKPDQVLRLEDARPQIAEDLPLEEVEGTIIDSAENDIATTTPPPSLTRKQRISVAESTSQGTLEDRSKLMRDILTKYNKGVNPDNVKLEFGVNLVDFRVRDENNAIESYVWLRYSWVDSRLAWDPEEYNGVQVLRIDSQALWKPDITLYNSADPVNMINCWETNTVVFSTGNVIYIPPCKMTSQCELSLRKHPYGDQECSMKFGSWTFDGNVLDLQFYNGTNAVDLSQLQSSSGFKVVSTTGVRNVRYYSCCPDPYPDLTFNVTLRRIPAEELFNKLN